MKYDAMSACFERIRKTLDEREKGHYLPYEANADEADYVTIVKNYIKSDYKTATLEAAASLVHYSPAYLSSAFKTDTGVSFSRYLLQVRDGTGHADAVGSFRQILRDCRCRRLSEPQKSHP